jgi:hypothetical protein
VPAPTPPPPPGDATSELAQPFSGLSFIFFNIIAVFKTSKSFTILQYPFAKSTKSRQAFQEVEHGAVGSHGRALGHDVVDAVSIGDFADSRAWLESALLKVRRNAVTELGLQIEV